jgi:hypothetical protein
MSTLLHIDKLPFGICAVEKFVFHLSLSAGSWIGRQRKSFTISEYAIID